MNDCSWLVDLSRGDNWTEVKRYSNYEPKWTVEEIMDYYGEWIESEEVAADMMEEVLRRTPPKFRRSFSAKMNLIRDLLKYEYGHNNIPFVSRYSRSVIKEKIKNEA